MIYECAATGGGYQSAVVVHICQRIAVSVVALSGNAFSLRRGNSDRRLVFAR